MTQIEELSNSEATPLYIQVAELLKSKIIAGEYKLGERLPRELTLAENYNVSRITIRSALDLLANEGVIIKKQGKGTFVTNKSKTVSMDSVQGFYSLLVQNGGNLSTKLKNITIGLPTEEIQDVLEIEENTNILTMERLYIVNEQPFALTKTYFFKEVYLNKEDTKSLTAYGILVEKLDEVPCSARYNLSIISGSRDIRESLNLTEESPIQLLKRTTLNMEGKPLEYTYHFIHPDHCNLEFSLTKNDKSLEDLRITN